MAFISRLPIEIQERIWKVIYNDSIFEMNKRFENHKEFIQLNYGLYSPLAHSYNPTVSGGKSTILDLNFNSLMSNQKIRKDYRNLYRFYYPNRRLCFLVELLKYE